MNPNELTKLLERQEWTFAKTMPKCPHWYTLRKRWQSDSLFCQAVMAIREIGMARPWGRYRGKAMHIYFDANGWTYWSMGAPVQETILINRAKIKADEPAPTGLDLRMRWLHWWAIPTNS